MKKMSFLLIVIVCITSILIGCTDNAGTKKLQNDFIGKTFSGSKTSTSGFGDTAMTTYTSYDFSFTDEDTVTLTKVYAVNYGKAYNKSNTRDQNTEELSYALKKTRSGESYVFIEGFGSNGKDTSKNKKGLEVVYDKSGEIDYFVYVSLGERILMRAK